MTKLRYFSQASSTSRRGLSIWSRKCSRKIKKLFIERIDFFLLAYPLRDDKPEYFLTFNKNAKRFNDNNIL